MKQFINRLGVNVMSTLSEMSLQKTKLDKYHVYQMLTTTPKFQSRILCLTKKCI